MAFDSLWFACSLGLDQLLSMENNTGVLELFDLDSRSLGLETSDPTALSLVLATFYPSSRSMVLGRNSPSSDQMGSHRYQLDFSFAGLDLPQLVLVSSQMAVGDGQAFFALDREKCDHQAQPMGEYPFHSPDPAMVAVGF